MYDNLREFVKENGRLPNLQEEYNGKPIGRWTQSNRLFKQKGPSGHSAETAAKLEAIPGWYW